MSDLILSICDPLTVVMLTLESLKPGEVLSETDYRLMLQNVHHINQTIKWCQKEQEYKQVVRKKRRGIADDIVVVSSVA